MMQKEVQNDILTSLDETITALQRCDFPALKDVSNHTIHNASIFQDQESISIAVVTFAIFKIGERSSGDKKRELCRGFLDKLRKAREDLAAGDEKRYRDRISNIFKTISEEDERLRLFIEEVIDQAQIKKGLKLYEHGISLAQTAELLSLSQYELMNYVGKTRMTEAIEDPTGIVSRLQFTRRLFDMQ